MSKDNTNDAECGNRLRNTQESATPGALSRSRINQLIETAHVRGTAGRVYDALLLRCDERGRYRGHVGDFTGYAGVGYDSVRKALAHLRGRGLIVQERRSYGRAPGVWCVVAIGPCGQGPTT